MNTSAGNGSQMILMAGHLDVCLDSSSSIYQTRQNLCSLNEPFVEFGGRDLGDKFQYIGVKGITLCRFLAKLSWFNGWRLCCAVQFGPQETFAGLLNHSVNNLFAVFQGLFCGFANYMKVEPELAYLTVFYHVVRTRVGKLKTVF